jgi:hypothetical protein
VLDWKIVAEKFSARASGCTIHGCEAATGLRYGTAGRHRRQQLNIRLFDDWRVRGRDLPESFASLGTRLEIASSNYVMPGSFMSSGSTVTVSYNYTNDIVHSVGRIYRGAAAAANASLKFLNNAS